MDIDVKAMKEYVQEKLAKMNDYSFMENDYAAVVSKLVDTEVMYINSLEPDADGEFDYDDEEAFDMIQAEMEKAFPQYRMYIEALTDDYLDVSERYLSESGEIDWE